MDRWRARACVARSVIDPASMRTIHACNGRDCFPVDASVSSVVYPLGVPRLLLLWFPLVCDLGRALQRPLTSTLVVAG